LAQWAGLDVPGRTYVTFRTADACDLLDLSPLELGRLLATQPGLSEREGPRLVCLEMLPAGNDAGPRLNAILTRARREAQARIRQVMTYAAGDLCRHVALANHLGEALPPCGTSCDICLSTADAGAVSSAASNVDTTTARAQWSSADAFTVLNAVKTLPFPMGKTGLARLLLGSVESRVRGDRSPAFGALKDFKKGKVERLIDRLVEDGFLFRDLDHEYKLISLTDRGARAGVDELIAYDEEEASPRSSSTGPSLSGDEELSPEDASLLLRLQQWRRERASRDAVPPYVVAHNATLAAIAQIRPGTHADLLEIKGFGPARTEKYGDEILTVIGESIGTSDSEESTPALC
jgi:ATP-dependent DNA helicase RecQ